LIYLEYNGFYDQVQECKGLLLSLIEVMERNKKTIENKDILTENNIEEFRNKKYFKSTSRNILGVKKQDDWINYLNIGNIMFITALIFDDLDLESDYKFELLKDALMEKIIMIAISIFSYSSEIRLLGKNIFFAENKHRESIEISCKFLPNACPITMHFITSYFKHYNHLKSSELNEIKKPDIFQSTSTIKTNTNNSLSVIAELEIAKKKKTKINLLNKSYKPPIIPVKNSLNSSAKTKMINPLASTKQNTHNQPVKVNSISSNTSKEKPKQIIKSNSEMIQISSQKDNSQSSRTKQINKNIIDLCENSNTFDIKRLEKPSKSPNIFSNNNINSLFTKSISSFKTISKSFTQNKKELESKRISTSNSNTNLKSNINDNIDNLNIIFKTANTIEIGKEINISREKSKNIKENKSTIHNLQTNQSNKIKPTIVNITSKNNIESSNTCYDIKKSEKKTIKNYILRINPNNSLKTLNTSTSIYTNYNKSVSYVESNVIYKKK
jgi:hypothetical protein